MARIVAITGCPTGVAHTYMAAEALKKTAAILGHELKVESPMPWTSGPMFVNRGASLQSRVTKRLAPAT